MEKLLSYMDAHSAGLEALTAKVDGLNARLRQLEQPNLQGAQASANSDTQTEPAEAVLKKPGDHRTAPHKLLLLWPSVQPLFAKSGMKHHDSYVMEAEDRGLLGIYTRGEGIDEHDGTQPGGPASPARSEENGNEGHPQNAPTPPDGLWGTGFPQTQTLTSDTKRSEPYGWGGLKPDGTLDIDPNTIDELYSSYMTHIHVMHPFLDKQRLKTTIDVFKKRYCMNRQKSRAAFVATMDDNDSSRAIKKQRSNGMNDSVSGYENVPERSPGNALVYLVLALGKICAHKQPLPSLVADSKLNANAGVAHQLTGRHGISSSSPLITPSATVKPSPISPNTTPAAQSTPPTDGVGQVHPRSRRSSMDGSAHAAGTRNLDVIPGLAYLRKGSG